MFYWITWFVVKSIRVFFFPLKVFGLENLPTKGSFILASNHQSYLDPMIIPICIRRRLNFVAKEELFENKFLSWILRHLEAFPIKKKSSDVRAIKEILQRLQKKGPILIFPQGTRSVKNDKHVEAGIGLIAIKSGLPVIPVCVKGSDKVLPPKAKSIKRHPITVIFGKPLLFKKGDSYFEIARQIMNKISSLSPTPLEA